MKCLRPLVIACCLLAGAPPGGFGQNKVINRSFRWQIQPMPHFNIYYYDRSGERLLPYVERYLAGAHRRAARVLPNTPKERTPFFLYNTHNDFEQTNITPIGEGTAGVTELFKNRFIVGNRGSHRFLEYVIAHEFIHEVEFEYLFGGFWRSVLILKSVFYPSWLMEGLAEYASGDLDRTTRDMYLRDAATADRLLPLEQLYNFNHVLPHQVTLAYKESEAFMRFLAEEYGKDKLPQLLIAFQDHFDQNSVLQDVVGTDLFVLDRKFTDYLKEKYATLPAGLEEPAAYGRRVTPSGAYPRFFESGVFSPDGETVAYISDETGQKEIYRLRLPSGKPERVWNLDRSIRVEDIHNEGNGLSFSPDGKTIAFGGEREQRDYLYLYDMQGCAIREFDTGTETVVSPAFSPDGSVVYFSGIKDGFRNIYAFRLSDRTLAPVTTGPMDKTDAWPSPDGRSLYFAEERYGPDGRIEYDLCRLDLASGEKAFITALPGDERFPFPRGGLLYFSSDRDGITDLYALPLSGGPAGRLTRVIGGNFQPRVSPDGNLFLFASFRGGEQHLYLGDARRLSPVETVAPGDLPPEEEPPLEEIADAPSRPYRFKASTDLFFPALFYSSLDGLYVAAYWQASDFLGNHQLQTQVSYANAVDYLDYTVAYGFLPLRTQFFFTFGGQQFYADLQRTIQRKENRQSVLAAYPLNRYESAEFLLGTIEREERVKGIPAESWERRENVTGLAFVRDTARGPYLEATAGLRLRLSGEFSEKVLGGDYRYQRYLGELQKFFPLGGEHVLLVRSLAGASSGPDAGAFRLGGEDRVRGVPQNATFAGTEIVVNTVEWRFPLVRNINYHMWYIFPDFFFKTLYGTLFFDAGYVGKERGVADPLSTFDYLRSSVGTGLRFHTFILQSFPLLLQFQLARQLDGETTIFYFGAGTGF